MEKYTIFSRISSVLFHNHFSVLNSGIKKQLSTRCFLVGLKSRLDNGHALENGPEISQILSKLQRPLPHFERAPKLKILLVVEKKLTFLRKSSEISK